MSRFTRIADEWMHGMQRSITTWQICDPKVMATMQSDAAIEHAFIDARKDIIHQHAKIAKLLGKVEELEAALKPFARFACEPQLSCECHNCTAKNLLGK